MASHIHATIGIVAVSQTALTFRNYTYSEPRFHALLTNGDAEHLAFERT